MIVLYIYYDISLRKLLYYLIIYDMSALYIFYFDSMIISFNTFVTILSHIMVTGGHTLHYITYIFILILIPLLQILTSK